VGLHIDHVFVQALFDVSRITKRSMGGIGGDYQVSQHP
jgi:hypothetical protein